uniref:Mucin n=1 Tax=Rhipicephalus zambeziensis TaxID=60191 RepID=A0A224YD37_9ACAR
MHPAYAITAVLVHMVTAFPGQPMQEGPPIERNPDCNGTKSENYTYQSCTTVCGGDEAIIEPPGRRCWLKTEAQPGPVERSSEDKVEKVGYCDNDGKCVETLAKGENQGNGETEEKGENEETEANGETNGSRGAEQNGETNLSGENKEKEKNENENTHVE